MFGNKYAIWTVRGRHSRGFKSIKTNKMLFFFLNATAGMGSDKLKGLRQLSFSVVRGEKTLLKDFK